MVPLTQSPGPVGWANGPGSNGMGVNREFEALDRIFATVVYTPDGTIRRANRRYVEMFGYSLDEIVGRSCRMFTAPEDDCSGEQRRLLAVLAAGEPIEIDCRRLRKDGSEIWLQAGFVPLLDAGGILSEILQYATDITARQLKAADERGQLQAINESQAVIHFTLDGTILNANALFLKAMGYRLEEVKGRHHRMFVDPAYALSMDYAAFWTSLANGMHQAAEYRRLGKDGREVWLRATYTPICDAAGRPFKIVKYATDITLDMRRRADIEGQLRAIDRSQGVISFDLDGTIIEANDNFLAILGYRLDEIQGRHHRILVEPAHAQSREYATFWNALRAGRFMSAMYKRIGKGGREVWIRATYNPVLDPDGHPTRVIKFATDVTSDIALAEAFEDAKRQAQHDSSTALPNRVHLASFMSAALAQPNSQLVVFYLDLDRFKPINDTYGHAMGDRVLGEVADRLRRCLRDGQIVARVGGDEFVVAAPNLSDEEIEAFCHTMLQSVSAPIRHEGGELAVGMSIGVAIAPADGQTPDELLRCADAALYCSKSRGRGTFSVYSTELDVRNAINRASAEEMRHGIEAGEFFLEYQPRFNAKTQAMQSVEALLRWAHPLRGRIAPGDFISLAEKSGLIVPLGEWVLRTACRAASRWDGIGVSVNVSPVQFQLCDLPAIVASALEETRLRPELLELELTEGVLMDDALRARATLEQLKALGVRLAMDDFGTGYSSLSYLRDFPFDVLKIDRRFISDIEERQEGRAIVQAILGLGKALGLSVTAEGVETAGQLLMLTKDDCPEVQCYLLARPMSEEHLAALLEHGDDGRKLSASFAG